MKLSINGNETYESVDYYSFDYDPNWDRRKVIYLVLNMDAQTALSLFIDNVNWGGYYIDIDEETLEERSQYVDFSEYCIAGPIKVNRDGTVTVSMAQKTELEKLQDSIFITKEEAETAYSEGVNES